MHQVGPNCRHGLDGRLSNSALLGSRGRLEGGLTGHHRRLVGKNRLRLRRADQARRRHLGRLQGLGDRHGGVQLRGLSEIRGLGDLALAGVKLLQALLTETALVAQNLVEVGRVRCMVEDFSRRAGLQAVLVRLARDLLARARHTVVLPQPGIVGGGSHVDHRQRSQRGRGWPPNRQAMRHGLERIAVDDVAMGEGRQQIRSIGCLGGGGVSSLAGPRPFFTSQVIFGEPLLARLAFPVIVAHTPSIHDDPAAELTKDRLGRDDGNLARPIRVRQNILLDEVVFFDLRRDDLVQRPVLVEQQV